MKLRIRNLIVHKSTMDIYRRELEQYYLSQNLEEEDLPKDKITQACRMADGLRIISNGCVVVTDISCDHCYVYSGSFGVVIGYEKTFPSHFETDSSDEDLIYECIHPEDLVEKRLLEYEFFKFVDSKDPSERKSIVARCKVRMKDRNGIYRVVDNSTQVLMLSPQGKVWLVLCSYALSTSESRTEGIEPCLLNTENGELTMISLSGRRKLILSEREKEILSLIKDGMLSKQIADTLGISIHTVNRHRQNILEKLSVGNSVEAVAAAIAMNLL